MSLVADYDSNSESDSENERIDSGVIDNAKTNEEIYLKLPDLNSALNVENSVFATPFKQAETSRLAVLERHVKLVPSFDELTSLNGKKICWSYKNGRCRFGNKCKYAHDREIQIQTDKVDEPSNHLNALIHNLSNTKQSSVNLLGKRKLSGNKSVTGRKNSTYFKK